MATPRIALASTDSSAPRVVAPPDADSLRLLVDRALLASRPTDFDDALAYLDRQLQLRPGDPVLLHYQGFALFRKASALTSAGQQPKVVKRMLEQADGVLEQSFRSLPWPETLALRSAVAGQLIGSSGPFGAMRLGPRSSKLLDEAMAMNADNPRVWMLRGISSLYKPRLFGGSAEKAERDLTHALLLFERDHAAAPAPWWGHAETYGWLGQAYARQGRIADARAAYLHALQLEPDYAWVARDLLPALERESR
ncbi:MAG: tetratricopeptide repeat protein [Gemmatimonadaceae bacterium]